MNAIVRTSSPQPLAPLPEPRTPVTVRAATLADLPFIDSLQKKHSKMVGFMPAKQIEGKIAAGHVLVAEENGENSEFRTMNDESGGGASPPFIVHRSPFSVSPSPLGYVIGQDQYFKRDDVGIIYQMSVVPGRQRGFIGATLLRAMFDRAAYGCRLFCCWCAQDIAANRFWEAMGFVPLAFRAGSAKKSRVHIFWQKRIRHGDTETPWWFPSQTTGGSIREDRLVLPIPPGTHWSDAKPIILPAGPSPDVAPRLPGRTERARPSVPTAPPAPRDRRQRVRASVGGLWSAPAVAEPAPGPVAKAPPEKKPKAKNDPKLVAAARELRDRYLEEVNAGGMSLEGAGKYDVTRALPTTSAIPLAPSTPPMLPAA